MKLARMLPAVLVCAGLCAAQQTPEPQDAPSGLVVLKVKRERHREEHDVKVTATDPNLSQSTGIMPSGATPTMYVYEYWLDIRNDSAKKVMWLSWVYVLSDPNSKQELDRQEFVTFEKISAAQKKTVVGRKRFPPSEAELIAELVRRDLPYYDPRIPEEKVASMNRFAKDIGLLAGPLPYEQVVATEFSHLWNEPL